MIATSAAAELSYTQRFLQSVHTEIVGLHLGAALATTKVAPYRTTALATTSLF